MESNKPIELAVAIDLIMQFLKENNLQKTFQTMAEETHLTYC